MEDSLFAYSLCQCEQGWSWRLWDETGDVVAAGHAPDQINAHRRLIEAFERTRDAAADREETSDVDGMDLSAAPAAGARLAGGRRSVAPPAATAAGQARAGLAT